MSSDHRTLKLSLFILGSFIFSWIDGVVLHELGHAIAQWVTGGIVEKISINPFSWSYTYYGSTPKFPIFNSWAGVLIGALLGLIVLVMVGRHSSPYVVPFLFLGVAPMLNGGGYYIADLLIMSRGDATRLMQLGIPKAVLVAFAVVMLILGILYTSMFVDLAGLTAKGSFVRRLFIIAFGIIPYFVIAFIYSRWISPQEVSSGVFGIAAATLLVIVVAVISHAQSKNGKNNLADNIKWRHVVYADVLGVLAIVIPFLLFPGSA